MVRNWFKIALLNFVIAAVMGAVLRFAFIKEIPGLDFKNFLHGHSHLAMLGWVYLGLFCLYIHYFVSQPGRIYSLLFWGAELSTVGMLIAFPMEGYAPTSISFSTLHIILSYAFVWQFLRDFSPVSRHSGYARFIRASLLFMIFSTLALWGMAPVMVLQLQHSPIYFMLVQAFLHFQFNGWFVFGALGLLFYYLERRGVSFPRKQMLWFFWLMVTSCLFTYALALTWADPEDFLFLLNSFGAGLQLIALAMFLRLIGRNGWKLIWPKKMDTTGILLGISVTALVGKVLIQSVVIIPFLAEVAYTIRNFVVGFIHLIQLGVMSCLLLGLAAEAGWLEYSDKFARTGIQLFLAGFLLSEFLLFFQGLLLWAAWGFIPFYYELIFGISALMPIGLAMVLWANKSAVVTS